MIKYKNKTNLIITDLKEPIYCIGCSTVTIKNCYFTGKANIGVELEECQSVAISNCVFENLLTGVYAYKSKYLKVFSSSFKNVWMKDSHGQYIELHAIKEIDLYKAKELIDAFNKGNAAKALENE